jgi:hypothetical protein
MTGQRWRRRALLLGAASALIASGTAAGAAAPGTGPTSSGKAANSGPYAYLAHGPYSTQAICESHRQPSDPPDLYSFPCGYSPNGTYYPPHYTQPGWYWVMEYSIR